MTRPDPVTPTSTPPERPEPPTRADRPRATPDVVVVGSGLAGLTAAAVARRAGASVVVIDGPAPGGRARTDDRQGFLLNLGPHALYDRAPGRSVLARLGITPRGAPPPRDVVLTGATGDRSLRLSPRLAVQGLLGPTDLVRTARFARRLLRLDPATVADRSAARWLAECLPPAPRALLAVLTRVATYSADLDRLSADVAAHQLVATLGGVTYLDDGWAQLTDALRDRAPGVPHLSGRARAVLADAAGPTVITDAGPVRGRRVVVAVGSPGAAAQLLPGTGPRWTDLGPPVEVSCLDLALRRTTADRAWFGVDRPLYLVPHAPPARLAPPGGAVVHAMRNLSCGEVADPAVVRSQLRALAVRAGISEADVVVERYLHRMVVVSASVTPESGGLARRPGVGDSGVDGVLLAGDWVGPRGWLADASLASGEEAGAAAAAGALGTREGVRALRRPSQGPAPVSGAEAEAEAEAGSGA